MRHPLISLFATVRSVGRVLHHGLCGLVVLLEGLVTYIGIALVIVGPLALLAAVIVWLYWTL